MLKAAGLAVEAAAAAPATPAAEKHRLRNRGKMLIAISPDTTACWDKSN